MLLIVLVITVGRVEFLFRLYIVYTRDESLEGSFQKDERLQQSR